MSLLVLKETFEQQVNLFCSLALSHPDVMKMQLWKELLPLY